MVNTILKEADLFCPNNVRINFTIYHINILIVLLSSFIITIGIIIPTVFASSISISFNPKGGQGVLNGKKKGIYHYLKANRIPKFQIKKSTHGAVKASLYRSKFLVDEPLGTRTTTVGNHYYKKTTTSSSCKRHP